MSQHIKRGFFITLEGLDGSGKSTGLELIQEILTQHKIEFITTREPGGTTVAEIIRQLVTEEIEEQIYPETELLLIFAARIQHICRKILPALDEGKWVICDRFIDSTYAYQCGGRELPLIYASTLERHYLKDINIGCTFLFTAPLKVCLERIKKREDLSRFEKHEEVFFSKVEAEYLHRLRAHPFRIREVDTSGTIEETKEILHHYLIDFINRFDRNTLCMV